MKKTKLCQKCKTEIPKKAIVCPNCKSRQWSALEKGAIIFLVIGFIATAFGTDDKKENDKPKEIKVVQSSNTESIVKEDVITVEPTVEITFQDISWGESFTTVDEKMSNLNLMNISGESFMTMSVDEITLGDYKGIDFEYSDINIVGSALNKEIEVAGYTTSEVQLFFAYVPVDGVLTKTENDSSFYGARYTFEPQDLNKMKDDLVTKLSSLYGEPAKTTKDTDIFENEYTYTYWYGLNDTELVLKTLDATNDTTAVYTNQIMISYAWRKGDELLQNASNILKKEAQEKESAVYDNADTNGL